MEMIIYICLAAFVIGASIWLLRKASAKIERPPRRFSFVRIGAALQLLGLIAMVAFFFLSLHMSCGESGAAGMGVMLLNLIAAVLLTVGAVIERRWELIPITLVIFFGAYIFTGGSVH